MPAAGSDSGSNGERSGREAGRCVGGEGGETRSPWHAAYILAIAALYGYAAVSLAGMLWWPFGRDQGIFAWVGDVIARGGAPYRDAWEIKGPATYYTYAFSQLLFGRELWGIRLLDLVFVVVTCLALFRFLRRYCHPLAAHFAVAFFALLHVLRGYWATAQPDGWATMLVVIAGALALTPAPTSSRTRLVAGVLIGIAALYKVLFAGFLIPLAVYEWLGAQGSARDRIARLAPLAAGSAGVVALALVAMALQGSLSDFMQIQTEFLGQVHSDTRPRSLAGAMRQLGIYLRFYSWMLGFCLLGVVTLWRTHRRLAWALAAQLAVAIACVVIQNKYYSYHWYPIRLSLVLYLAFGISGFLGLIQRAEQRIPVAAAWLCRALVLGALLVGAWMHRPPLNDAGWAAVVFRSQPVESYYREFKSYYNRSFSFLSNYRVSRYVEEHSQPSDRVLVFGWEPMINFLSGRAAPTRFGYDYPLVAGDGGGVVGAYRDEFVNALREQPPLYIVVADGDRNSLMPRASKRFVEEIPEFGELMRRRYRHEVRIGNFDLWRRASAGGFGEEQADPVHR
jgi:hypothetical protein